MLIAAARSIKADYCKTQAIKKKLPAPSRGKTFPSARVIFFFPPPSPRKPTLPFSLFYPSKKKKNIASIPNKVPMGFPNCTERKKGGKNQLYSINPDTFHLMVLIPRACVWHLGWFHYGLWSVLSVCACLSSRNAAFRVYETAGRRVLNLLGR